MAGSGERAGGGAGEGVPTVEPIDGSLGGGRVVKRHGGLSLGLPGVPVGEQVDHGLARLLVHLRGEGGGGRREEGEGQRLSETLQVRRERGRMKRSSLLGYLDDSDLLEELSHFVSGDVFAQSFHEDGVVVRVVLLP